MVAISSMGMLSRLNSSRSVSAIASAMACEVCSDVIGMVSSVEKKRPAHQRDGRAGLESDGSARHKIKACKVGDQLMFDDGGNEIESGELIVREIPEVMGPRDIWI